MPETLVQDFSPSGSLQSSHNSMRYRQERHHAPRGRFGSRGRGRGRSEPLLKSLPNADAKPTPGYTQQRTEQSSGRTEQPSHRYNHSSAAPTIPTSPPTSTLPTGPRGNRGAIIPPTRPRYPEVYPPFSPAPVSPMHNINSRYNPQAPSFHPTQDYSYYPVHPQPPGRMEKHSQPLLKDESWKTWPEIAIRLTNLPIGIETLTIWNEFHEDGVLESIDIHENNYGTKTETAVVKFSKVNGPFWEDPKRHWRIMEPPVYFKLEKPRRSFIIPSPIKQSKTFPESFKFKAETLDFGFMYKKNTMMTMYTTDKQHDVDFIVDLRRRVLVAYLKIWIEQQSGTPSSDEEEVKEQETLARLESYRFRIPFGHLDKLLEQPQDILSPTERSIIIPLPSPPQFWRKLHNLTRAHEDGSSFWTADDEWFRQTAIVYDPREMSDALSLNQEGHMLEIGRWTVYRLKFNLHNEEKTKQFNSMLDALHDFNVNTETAHDLEVSTDRAMLKPVWDFINTSSTKGSSLLELMADAKPTLSYAVRYQLEVCISRNCLNEYNMGEAFVHRLAALPEHEAVSILEYVADNGRFYNPIEIFDVKDIKTASTVAKLPDYCAIMRKANVTPSTVYYSTPSVETTNRVVRHFKEHADRFLRVQFKDELSQGRVNAMDKRTWNEVFTRMKTTLDNGIVIGDRRFEFLACGNSQLREHGAYFFAPTEHITASDIRAWMGQFKDIKVVAKYAARLGQCFSTSRAINTTKVQVKEIPDVEYGEHCFTDGVGKISKFVAELIADELRLNNYIPSCFQFRLGGCKGVLAVSSDAQDREVHIRPSQRKFTTIHDGLEVIRCSQFAAATLNRQIIIVLSALGVDDEVFSTKLRGMLSRYQQAMSDPKLAIRLLRKHIDPNQSTLELANMCRNGFQMSQEPFVTGMLFLWRAWTIKYLKEKARILIDQGAFVLGVTDEYHVLKGYELDENEEESELAEIFIQISDPDRHGAKRVIRGPCVVARNPSLHPGDVRKVMAVDYPELHHLVDVVVFSQQGERDLPSMLSGGDLDGDDYLVIWDSDVVSNVENNKPMNYFASPPQQLDRDVEVHDITSFFVNYIKNDRLGSIANAHLAWADRLEEGVKSGKCHELAELHSQAVDYPKTGEPAQLPKALRTNRWPHFMEKEEEKTYQSTKILGQLYDMVERVDFVPDYNLPFNETLLGMCTLPHGELLYLRELKDSYDTEMRRYMAQNAIKTEFEVFSTFVLHHDNTSKDYKFHEEIGQISSNLKNRFRDDVIKRAGCVKTPHDHAQIAPYAIGMYVITAQAVEEARKEILSRKIKNLRKAMELDERDMVITKANLDDMPLMSFPWIFADILGEILNHSIRTGRTKDLSTDTIYEDLGIGIPIQEFHRVDVGEALPIEEI